MMIKCSKCGQVFIKGERGSRQNRCVLCRRKENISRYYHTIETARKYTRTHKKEKTQYDKQYDETNKINAFKYYSNNNVIKCCKCDCDDIRTLQIDHIENNGATHRKDIGNGNIYKWLKKNNYPSGYQILCANCNWKKHLNNIKIDKPTNIQKYRQEYSKKLKKTVFSHYDKLMCCNRCKTTDIDILTLDHIEGSGKKHMRQIGIKGGGGFAFYSYLRKHKYPQHIKLQILCFNCQFIKERENAKNRTNC
jgi:hypothetical protein